MILSAGVSAVERCRKRTIRPAKIATVSQSKIVSTRYPRLQQHDVLLPPPSGGNAWLFAPLISGGRQLPNRAQLGSLIGTRALPCLQCPCTVSPTEQRWSGGTEHRDIAPPSRQVPAVKHSCCNRSASAPGPAKRNLSRLAGDMAFGIAGHKASVNDRVGQIGRQAGRDTFPRVLRGTRGPPKSGAVASAICALSGGPC